DEARRVVGDAFQRDDLKGVDLRPLWLEGGWTHSVAGRFEECIEMCSAGIAGAARARDGLTGRLLLQIARAETVQGKAGDAVAHALEAESIFEERDDLRGLATALRIVGNAYTYLGQLDEAALALRRGLDMAQRLGSVEEVGGCLINLGLVELKRGELTGSIACDRRAIEEVWAIG